MEQHNRYVPHFAITNGISGCWSKSNLVVAPNLFNTNCDLTKTHHFFQKMPKVEKLMKSWCGLCRSIKEPLHDQKFRPVLVMYIYLCCFVIRVPSGDFHMKDLIHRIFFYVYGPVLVSKQVCSLPILACFTHFYGSTITK